MNLGGILLLLAFQLLGEFLHRVMSIPLSGPLLGMAMLFLALLFLGGPSTGLQDSSRPLLAGLALLFVPPGVGVIAHLELLGRHWLPILVATVGGAVVSLLVTAATMLFVERLLVGRADRRTSGRAEPGFPAQALHDAAKGEQS